MRVPASLPAWAKLALLLLYVALTNPSVPARLRELAGREEYPALVVFLAIWAVSLACLVAACFLPRLGWRLLWAVPIALSVFAGEAFSHIARSRLTLDDALILWVERARWGDAVMAYGGWLARAGFAAVAGVLVLSLPARLPERATQILSRLWWAPAVPMALILAVLLARGGTGTGALPQQFLAGTLFATAVAIDAGSDLGARRRSPEIVPVHAPMAADVVLVIDESVRADFLDLNEDRGSTPFLASRAAQLANFGAAVAAGNCSNSSNAAIRPGGTRADFASSIHESPFIWEYAAAAGYETVYLDAQKGYGLQNWMTVRELAQIDRFERFAEYGRAEGDRALAERLRELLADDRPQFVIANKSGAHFPYEQGYPPSEALFAPHMKPGDSIGESREKLVNSYRNLVRWNVDGFFRALIGDGIPAGAVILYTSDHGQNLMDRGVLTHCNTQSPHPYEAWVPLLVLAGGAEHLEEFRAAARRNRDRASHFEIYPTLLRLFGYDPDAVSERYGPDLFAALPGGERRFTVGPVLLYFGRQPRWSSVPADFAGGSAQVAPVDPPQLEE